MLFRSWRVWTFGLVGTAAAALLTYAWAYLCAQVWDWPIQVPRLFDPADLVDASYWRIETVTVAVGVAATAGAALLARTLIGPRIWWLIISMGLGLTSLYGALTLPGTDLTLRLRVSVLHVLVMATVIPALAMALRISDADVTRTLSAHHSAATDPTSAPTQQSPVEPPTSPNDTLILPPESGGKRPSELGVPAFVDELEMNPRRGRTHGRDHVVDESAAALVAGVEGHRQPGVEVEGGGVGRIVDDESLQFHSAPVLDLTAREDPTAHRHGDRGPSTGPA